MENNLQKQKDYPSYVVKHIPYLYRIMVVKRAIALGGASALLSCKILHRNIILVRQPNFNRRSIVSSGNQMDCNCTCIDVQAVLPSIWIPVSLAFLSTQILLFQ